MNKKEYPIIKIVFVVLWSTCLWGQGASIIEENKVIKTYPFSDPDPVPVMVRSAV